MPGAVSGVVVPDGSRPVDSKDQSSGTNRWTGQEILDNSDGSDGDTENRNKGSHGSIPNHAFSDPAVADYWRKKYEQAGYENRHRFDPSFQWTGQEEKKLIRKVRLCLSECNHLWWNSLLIRFVYRSTSGSCSGHGSCLCLSIFTEGTSTELFQTTWFVSSPHDTTTKPN